MALNKQRILSELGSVMNQLQSADCGCMGKLFSDPGQGGMGHPLPTCGGCRRGCCRGHGAPCGEPAGGMCGMGMGGGMPGIGGGMGGGMGGSMGGGMGSGMGGGMAGGMGGGMGGSMGGGMGGGMSVGGGMSGMSGGMTGGMTGGMDGGMPGSGAGHNGLDSGMMNGAGGMGGRGMGMPCMGSSNPKKVYADTYNYLNQNLMHPVVQDVYQELRSINQSNTVGNNPLANTMGLTPGNAAMQGNAAMPGNAMMQGNATGDANAMQNMSGMPAGNAMGHNPNQPMGGAMGGMGAQIMNMMGGMAGGSGKPKGVSNDGQMIIDASQSPNGQVGVAPMNQMSQSPGHTNASMGQGFMNPQTQYVTQDNMYGNTPSGQNNPMANSQPGNAMAMTGGMAQAQSTAGGNMGQQQMMGNMAQGNAVQNVSAPNQGGAGFMNQSPNMGMGNNARYGQHSQGMKKFNEMFPGLMNGDLGFDPMSIAIQMNPANQKRSAMDTMSKFLNGNFTKMEPSVAGANTAAAQLNQAPQQPQQNQVPANQMPNQQMMSQQNLVPSDQVSNQPGVNTGAVPQQNQQQVYQAVNGNQQYQQGQQQQMVDPNTGAIVNVSDAEYQGNEGDPNTQQQSAPSNQAPDPAQQQQQQQQMYKEPIFPAFTRNQVLGIAPPQPQKQYVYNTLGQPVELLPGNTYHTPEPSLPQTLSGNAHVKFKNPGGKLGVKSTVSKTSLMGIKPTGRVPSKSQLQQIYQQYKGSQSNTNQNVARMPGQASSSAGKLNSANNNVNQPPQIPVEKVGGDTAANNNQVVNKVEHVMGQIGDVPAAKTGEVDKAPPINNARLRNGLQDIVYTSAPSNVSWSFHGEYNPNMPYRSIYR